MFKPNEIEAFSMVFDKPMKELERRIMQDIVRRIRINGEITRAADWQINRLYELGVSKREIKKYIKDSLDLNSKEVNHLYKDIIRKGYERDEKLYKYKGKPFVPFEENAGLQTFISAVSVQTLNEMNNITQSLGFAVKQPDGKLKFQPIADYYQKTLDNAMLDIASGGFDYNTVLKRVVREMTNSGLRSVDYSTGRSNRIEVAARRAVMTGMSQLTAKVNEDNAKALDTDMFETTWHSGARPSHQVWQGKWYTRKQLETVCGLGTVTGLCGANCYHDYYPVVPGISEPIYTPEELAEMNRRENIPIEYNGKQYTKYEALQRQRRLETAMCAKRQEIKLLQDGGASEDDLMIARGRYRGLSQEYSMFSKAMDLPQQRERIYVDGLGNIGAGKYKKTVDKSAESGIIKENNKKPVTKITDKAVESVPNVKIQGYTDEQCEFIQNQHKELLRYSRDNNENKEVAFVFDNSFAKRKEFLGDDDRLDFGNELYGNELFVMHNHPRNSSYSDRDIRFIVGNDNVKSLSIIKNNGNVEVLTKTNIYDKDKAFVELKRCYKKYVRKGTDEEIDKAVMTFVKNNKGLLEWIKM